MPELVIETTINAPAERCFELVRDPRVHGETKVERDPENDGCGPRLGEVIRFESTFLGFSQVLVVRCIELIPPRRFVDAMIRGRFGLFAHIHEFEPGDAGTVLRDTLIWEARGLFDAAMDELLIKRRLSDVVKNRNDKLRAIAEGS
jgi:ligand-binding SRPBCC domain-containing protein